MKKSVIIYLISVIVIISLGLLVFSVLTNKNEFSYEEAKMNAEKYLNKNEHQLTKLVNELYESKASKKDSMKGVSYASYVNRDDFDFKNQIEYIKMDLDSQGMLGGQYYGLIYTNESKEKLIVYDENEITQKGNNIFIRQKIKGNWYFYYEDYDGKVNVDKIKK